MIGWFFVKMQCGCIVEKGRYCAAHLNGDKEGWDKYEK
jgi:hypothetical protein